MKILLLIFSISFSQSFIINVTDEENNTPLRDANIVLTSPTGEQIGKSTDSDGQSIFKNLNLGEYKINISFIGYEEVSTTHLLKEQNQTKYFKLKLKSILIPELNIIGDLNSLYKNLPGAGSVIKETTIRRINPIGTQELLEHIPGIQTVADDGIGNSRISIGIRGLYPRRSSRVLILEDGIPIQPALYVYPNMYYNPPVERLDGVQVLKGSGVIKYGPQTMGGVVNYTTRRPNLNFGGFINITQGENGYSSLFTELNGFSVGSTKNAFQFLYKKGDGFRDNNSFQQYNATFKSSYNVSDKKNIYSKITLNYENSNATYTGLTEYSFENNPKYNPKEDDNFNLFRSSIDFITTERISSSFKKTTKIFASYFDRNWWRETDVYANANNDTMIIDLSNTVIGGNSYEFLIESDFRPFDRDPENCPIDDDGNPCNLIRIGNGESNFGILRKFYVFGYEQAYNLDYGNKSSLDFGARGYWERFIDDKKIGESADARDGIYYIPADTTDSSNNFVDSNGNPGIDESPIIVGQSHHYETTAFSAYISNKFNLGSLSINTGLRLELFEQTRVDLLDGSSYLDNSTHVFLPSIGFIQKFSNIDIFGGIHRGYTAPSSGALKVSNFALDTGLDLKSEKSWNKELGVRSKNFMSFLDFEFSLFHLNIENLVAAGRGTAFQNLQGIVETQGTELYSKINLEQKSSFLPIINISHTFLETDIKTAELYQYDYLFDPYNGEAAPDTASSIAGNSLPYSPKHSFIIGIEKNIFNDKINIRLDYKYVDKVYTDFHNIEDTGSVGIRGPIESYSVINASLSYALSSKLSLNLSGKNIEDKIYIGSRLHSNPGQYKPEISSGIIPGPRRQINFSLKYTL